MSARDGKSRPIIMAMFRGPGPSYALPGTVGHPGHDFTKKQAPAFSFGLKGNWKYKDDSSPGPAYFLPEKLTRHGQDGTPRYSLHGRHNQQVSFRTPGPDAYQAEKVSPLREKKAPAYSFGSRTRYAVKDGVPAPNQYRLPDMIGSRVATKSSQPSYSMTGRAKIGGFHEDLQKTPGPGTYRVPDTSVNRKKMPHYSMTGRNLLPGDSTQKPGPGAYRPENVYVTKRIMPKFSFGVRHSEYTAPVLFAVD